MSVFKEALLKRQRIRSKQHKNRVMRKQRRGGREGKDSVLLLYRNCFDTVSLLHEFSICLCQIHYFKPQSCQMLIFYGMLTWQASLSVESVSFSQSWDLQPRKMCMLLWLWSINFAAEVSWQRKSLSLVPNNCRQNQCFHMEKKNHIMSNIRNSNYSPHIHEAIEMQI